MARSRDPQVDARILDAARELLAEAPLEAVSLTATAERAGVSRPTVYRRYRDSEDLLMAVLHADLERHWAEIRQVPIQDTDPLEFLVALSDRFFRYYAENIGQSRAMLKAALFAEGEWSERFSHQGAAFVGWVGQELEARKAAGALAEDCDPLVLAQAWFGSYLTLAVSGVNGARLPVPVQLHMLRMVLTQHLQGCRP